MTERSEVIPRHEVPRDPILLTPGPTPVPLKIRQALARPILHHRTSEFQAVLKEVGVTLKELFGTTQEVLILTSSGTGAMEAAVANLLSPGEEALVIEGGKFGQRWTEICRAYGIEVYPLQTSWGKPLNVEQLRDALHKPTSRDFKAVFTTLCETSTGVTYDIRDIRRAIGDRPLLVVDAISGLLAEPFSMDEFGVDATVCGSQKGLMLPPGLSFIALSARAWEAAERSRSPRFYFDLRLAREAWGQTDTPFTPGISLVVALAESLKGIKRQGIKEIIATHREHAQAVRKAIAALGLELYADPACASNAVTAVKVPPGINGRELLKRLRAQHGIVLAGGQGKELQGKIFRIATMGAIGKAEIEPALIALENVLKEVGSFPGA